MSDNFEHEPDALTAAYFKGCADTKERMRKRLAEVEERSEQDVELMRDWAKDLETKYDQDMKRLKEQRDMLLEALEMIADYASLTGEDAREMHQIAQCAISKL